MKKQNIFNKITSFRNKLIRSARKPASTKKRMPNSKVAVKNNKKSIFVKLLIGLLVILFFLALSDLFVTFLGADLKKYNDFSAQNYNWSGSERFNILIALVDDSSSGYYFIDRVLILNINPDDNKLGIFSIDTKLITRTPNNQPTTIRLSFMKGKEASDEMNYLIQGVENLAGLKINKYMLLDIKSVSSLLSQIPIPGVDNQEVINDVDFPSISKGFHRLDKEEIYNYLASDFGGDDRRNERFIDFFKLFLIQYKSPLAIFNIKNSMVALQSNFYTDLSRDEFLRLFIFITRLREDQMIVSYTKAHSSSQDPNDLFGRIPIVASIDQDLSSILLNPKVKFEQARIEVLNATDLPGVATRKTRQIQNSGGRVITTGNTPEEYIENFIFVRDIEKFPETIKEIKVAFNNNIEVLREEYPNRHVGDIVVVIGEPDI